MLTIENIHKLKDYGISFPMEIEEFNTHYEFVVSFNVYLIRVSLSRHTPNYDNDGNPHPNRNSYLMLCGQEMIWFSKEELKDMWNVVNGIHSFINKLA